MAKTNGGGPAADWRSVRDRLKEADFAGLFVDELGWDPLPRAVAPEVTVGAGSEDEATYALSPVAEKRGFVAYRCPPAPDGGIPARPVRDAIDRRVAKDAYEHFVVYAGADGAEQVWQWARREPGRPAARREHRLRRGADGEALARRIAGLAVSLKEEEDLTIVEVSGRVRAAFDVEPVTKKFYEGFQKQHAAFLGFIEGIEEQGDREWYASIMLNRLMFVYFIEKKGFLDGGDTRYLRNRMEALQAGGGGGSFLTFYRHFLMRLFHEGLSRERELRDRELDDLLGDVPYLNGGLFEPHELEREYPGIDVPDEAFEKLFDFFDRYTWHLDERPLREGNEINPDVLGYIFEKYINQKQMGAYYTKEDVTGYITQNTVIPRLFHAAEEECQIAFAPDGAMWTLLTENPDRYIYDAVKKGVLEDGEYVPLPEEIRAGVDDVSERKGWNGPADEKYALPTETWREHVARRQRCEDLRQKLVAGEVTAIDGLVTLNLDVRQFAQDAIENSEGTELLRAFYKGIENVSVLDPTCGSGAFLFAALNVLEPLYEACLERMERFVEGDASGKGYADFREILKDMDAHPNRRYFVLKSIVVRNLYGVDIMEEAVEIARLRLFLKLMAQLESKEQIEPLPDIDFNLRAGNTLVGFASMEEVGRTLDFGGATQRIEKGAKAADLAFARFHDMQTGSADSARLAEAKAELRERLGALNEELDRYLAVEYGVDPKDSDAFAAWRESHEPFHWPVEFHGIVQGGGFDVIVGNPPYVQIKDVKNYRVRNYETEACGDLYAYVLERSVKLSTNGLHGFIVPMSAFAVQKFQPLQDLYSRESSTLMVSSWSGDAHPSKLFEGVNKRLQIILARRSEKTSSPEVYTSKYLKWYSSERGHLFEVAPVYKRDNGTREYRFFESSLPKISSDQEATILKKLRKQRLHVAGQVSRGGRHELYYTRKVSFFLQFLNFIPEVRDEQGILREPSELKVLRFSAQPTRDVCLGALSSALFYWYFVANSDCRNLNKREIEAFPVPGTLDSEEREELSTLLGSLMEDYRKNAELRTVRYANRGDVTVQYFNFRPSKPIIDKIDRLLAAHYGLTNEELDFIVNYDYKYRMGAEAAG